MSSETTSPDAAQALPVWQYLLAGLYVIGWSTRLKKIQAIISAGDGACAALDILSAKAGEDIHDFDLIEDE